jgi:hypothetical protein
MKYLNLKTNYGIETVDQLERKDFNSYKEYITELKRLKSEYRLCGMDVYTSQRPDKTWNA